MALRDWAKNRSINRLPHLNDNISTPSAAVKSILCETKTIACLEERCQSCGIKRIENHVIALEKQEDDGESLKYTWDAYGKNDAGFLVILVKTGTPREFLNYLKEVLKGFAYHHFVVYHQAEQLQNLRLNLPKNAVLIMRDFAEKLVLRPKDETQR